MEVTVNKRRPELPEEAPDWLHSLVRRCLREDPMRRPSFLEILEYMLPDEERCAQAL